MITIEDFTLLPESDESDVATVERRIVRCLVCGRNGIVQRPESAAAYCMHAEQSEVLCDGMLVEPADCCDLT